MSYAFFDESFIKKINFEPIKPLQVKEAVSENFRRLVTTLTPNLLALIAQSAEDVPALNIYECARIWPYQETGTIERFVVSGIMADFKNKYDFYAGKAQLESLFDIFGISVTWKKIDQPPHPWYMPYQTAWIFHQEKCIGIAGKANPLFYHKVALGDAFIWEIDADFILSYQPQTHRYQPPSKYPRVHRDISILIPRLITVQELLEALRIQDTRINNVHLVDFFEKAEWDNKWALTLGITLEDHEKTLISAEVDAIIKRCMDYLISMGAQIR
jgi:phenylalanyl-tRNA synthetase beta subunit